MDKVRTGAYNPLPLVPIVLVGAEVDGRPNYLAAGFVGGVNVKPPIVYVSLNKRHHTPKGIVANGTFSLNIPSADYVIETDYCGLVSGRAVDKSAVFETFYGELKTAPMIAEFPLTCECRYTGRSVEFEMDTVYFGEVVQVYADREIVSGEGKLDILKANPFCYSGLENRYRGLGEDLGPGWSLGRQYRPASGRSRKPAGESECRCAIRVLSSRPALVIRSLVSLPELSRAVGDSLAALARYAAERGYTPAGPPFLAVGGYDGRKMEIETGFPTEPGIEGKGEIAVGSTPGGRGAVCRYTGPYEGLPPAQAALERWLEEQGHTAAGPAYQFYLNDPRTTAPDKLETEIVFLLK